NRNVKRQLRLGDARKIKFKGAALARLAIDPDEASALLDDAVDGGKSQAGALWPLGGKEGLEDVRLRVRIHAAAGIGDGEHYVVARRHRGALLGVALFQGEVGGLQNDLSALGHGVARVHREV